MSAKLKRVGDLIDRKTYNSTTVGSGSISVKTSVTEGDPVKPIENVIPICFEKEHQLIQILES